MCVSGKAAGNLKQGSSYMYLNCSHDPTSQRQGLDIAEIMLTETISIVPTKHELKFLFLYSKIVD